LELIEKKPSGIIYVLDEQVRFPTATDDTFIEKLNSSLSSNSRFIKNKTDKNSFGVTHYAGQV